MLSCAKLLLITQISLRSAQGIEPLIEMTCSTEYAFALDYRVIGGPDLPATLLPTGLVESRPGFWW